MGDVEGPIYLGTESRFHEVNEAYISVTHIDAGLQFSICPDLEDLCQYYHLSLMQFVPNTLRMWIGFRILYDLQR